MPAERLVEMMFGKRIVIADRPPSTLGSTAAAARRRRLRRPRRGRATLSIDVAAGEVLGLAGMEGSGQRTFLRGCAGLVDADRRHDRRSTARPHRAALRHASGLPASTSSPPGGWRRASSPG